MKNKIKNTIIGTLLAAAGAGGYFAGEYEPAKVDKIQSELKSKKQKRYVAFNPNTFGQKVMGALSVPEFADNVEHQAFGGYTFTASDEEVKEFKSRPGALTGIEIVEDRVYVAIMGCAKDPVPDPTPIPDPCEPECKPTPTPDPHEPGEYSDQVPWGLEAINAVAALRHFTGSSIKVAVLDTGVDVNHPDLFVREGADFTGSGVGYRDEQGHGTHVIGTVAAVWNNAGVGGVSKAQIYAGKVLDRNGAGYGSWISNGIIGAVNAGAKVISMSLGSPASGGSDPLIQRAVQYAHDNGVITVCANGNGSNLPHYEDPVGYPAKYCTLAVAASTINGKIASFSSVGPETDVIAPGVDVLSTEMGGGYVRYSGTSMATPHVAAVVALMLESGIGKLGYDVLDGLPQKYQGQGLVNALKSVGGSK